MTVEDAARLVSPAYAAAADRAAQLWQHAEEARAAVERCERDQRYFSEESDRRWRDMGFVRQVMHRSGAHTDPFIEAYADRRRGLAAEIEALRPYGAELARRLPEAEKQAAASLAGAARRRINRIGVYLR
jgi:hypothetical protein